jgi:photosystem II stability/assembly factor-like uncharacterized protein
VAYLTNLFVAVGDGGRAVRSSNGGLDWSPETSNTTQALRDVTRHFIYLVAVGDGGTTLRRTETSAVWDTTRSPTAAALHGVASNGLSPGILVAVGDAGTVLRSTDQGLSWLVQTLPGAPDLRAVAGGSNSTFFVAVGRGGVIYRSTNLGVDWGAIASPTTADLEDVDSDNTNRFVAVGTGGTIVRSGSDAASGSWFDVGAPFAVALHGIHWDDTRFYAVGDADVVARSQDGTTWIEVAVQPTSWTGVKTLYGRPAGR